jgi:hypothetical protein
MGAWGTESSCRHPSVGNWSSTRRSRLHNHATSRSSPQQPRCWRQPCPKTRRPRVAGRCRRRVLPPRTRQICRLRRLRIAAPSSPSTHLLPEPTSLIGAAARPHGNVRRADLPYQNLAATPQSSSIGASSSGVKAGVAAASCSLSSGRSPAIVSTLSLMSTMISGLPVRNALAFSRPWPSCSPS